MSSVALACKVRDVDPNSHPFPIGQLPFLPYLLPDLVDQWSFPQLDVVTSPRCGLVQLLREVLLSLTGPSSQIRA